MTHRYAHCRYVYLWSSPITPHIYYSTPADVHPSSTSTSTSAQSHSATRWQSLSLSPASTLSIHACGSSQQWRCYEVVAADASKATSSGFRDRLLSNGLGVRASCSWMSTGTAAYMGLGRGWDWTRLLSAGSARSTSRGSRYTGR